MLGISLLMRYDARPGISGRAPARWPDGTSIREASHDKLTLVMMAHPRCPCTRASLSELELIMARCRRRLEARVVFVTPPGTACEWAQTASWRKAASIPGLEVSVDAGGAEARRFHAFTSGQVFLYDQRGVLAFSGGITPSRGHVGGNAGQDAIVALARAQAPPTHATLAYGCSLFDPGSCAMGDTICTR